MNKKTVISIVAIIIIAIVALGGYFLLNNKEKTNNTSNNSVTNNTSQNNDNNEGTTLKGKTLVVYFSATGSTEKVAKEIAKNLNADLFEIEPEDAYTSADLSYTNENSRVSKEHDDESLRDVKLKNTKVNNWDNYDTVLIGYPIWWGIAAWPINTFVKANNFTGKVVIPFCTSASSSLGESSNLLKKEAKGGDWKEGHRFSSNSSNQDIKAWLDSLK